jgi:hypothetical protein
MLGPLSRIVAARKRSGSYLALRWDLPGEGEIGLPFVPDKGDVTGAAICDDATRTGPTEPMREPG